jgi:glycosyltransferase involved in cell wall biosynthesis
MIKLSLIIPVFNGEDHIKKCINSCLRQDIRINEYEIIIINDGSTDKTFQILLEFEKFSNIYIINQPNKGLGLARNEGLKDAVGHYIWFIDADDWIAENCLTRLISELDESDIFRILSIEVNNSLLDKKEKFEKGKKVISGIEYMKSDFKVCVPYYIFQRDFLLMHALEFKPLIFEDFEFTPRALFFAKKIKKLNFSVYYRLIREGSIMRSISVFKPYHLLEIIFSLKYFTLNYVNTKDQYIFFRLISMAINNYLNIALLFDPNQQIILNNRIYDNKEYFIFLVKSKKIKYLVEGILFIFFPKRTLLIYRVLSGIIKVKS